MPNGFVGIEQDVHVLHSATHKSNSILQDAIQSDRDDPGQPLVTPPFGHASQACMPFLNTSSLGRAVNVSDAAASWSYPGSIKESLPSLQSGWGWP